MRYLRVIALSVIACLFFLHIAVASALPSITPTPTLINTLTPQHVYKWTDSNGKIYYGDKPPNAKTSPLVLPALPIIKGGMPPTSAITTTPTVLPSYQLTINNPLANQTIYNNDGIVAVSLSVYPTLANQHALIVFVDGRSFNFAGGGTYNLSVGEGLHHLQAQVVDEQNQQLSSTNVIEFTLKIRNIIPYSLHSWPWWPHHQSSPTPMLITTPLPTRENFSVPFK
jgi:hypothetical protein